VNICHGDKRDCGSLTIYHSPIPLVLYGLGTIRWKYIALQSMILLILEDLAKSIASKGEYLSWRQKRLWVTNNLPFSHSPGALWLRHYSMEIYSTSIHDFVDFGRS